MKQYQLRMTAQAEDNILEYAEYRKMGLYKMVVRGYLIYYWIDHETETVHVTGIVYGKRNQAEQLAVMDLE